MECVLCNKQYARKSETAFNLRFNNHRKDVDKRKSLVVDQHFRYLVATSINTKNLH